MMYYFNLKLHFKILSICFCLFMFILIQENKQHYHMQLNCKIFINDSRKHLNLNKIAKGVTGYESHHSTLSLLFCVSIFLIVFTDKESMEF